MQPNFDYLTERKKTTQHLIRWKTLSMLLLGLLILGIYVIYDQDANIGYNGFRKTEYIARVKIDGVITDNLSEVASLDSLRQNTKIKALIVHINSPGGSLVGTEMLYNSIRKIAKSIPVVIIMGSIVVSGGYLIALAGDYIISYNGTITGSIKCIMQHVEIKESIKRIEVKFNNLQSKPLNSVLESTQPMAKDTYQGNMDNIDIYDYFIRLLASRRNIDLGYAKKISDGKVYSGCEALGFKLIDAVGNEDTAREWLEKERNIPKNITVRNVQLKYKKSLVDILITGCSKYILNIFNYNTKKPHTSY